MKGSNGIFELAKEGQIKKLICGAAVTDLEIIKRTSFLAGMAGQDIVDVGGTCAETVIAAVEGCKIACQRRHTILKPIVMASITPSEDDVHFKKASFNADACKMCEQCIKICPMQAITIDNPGTPAIHFSRDRCRGCGRCIEVCPQGAYTMMHVNVPDGVTQIRQSLAAGADAIEIHVSGRPIAEVQRILEIVHPIIADSIFSVCIGSLQSSPSQVADITHVISALRKGIPTFVQSDGSTMGVSGHGISALATAEVVLACQCPDIYVIASGDCSALTWAIVRLAKIGIAGIGMGIYMREKLRHLLDRADLFSNESLWTAPL